MRVLFVRLSAMGDVIQSAAALKLFRDAHPGVIIDWAVDRDLMALVERFNVADRAIAVESKALFAGSFTNRLQNLWREMRKLSALGSYDRVCCAHPDWRFSLLAALVHSKQRVSPKQLARTHGFIANRNRVFEYYRLLTGEDHGELAVDAALSALGKSVLATQREWQFKLPARYIVLMPGGARNALRDDPLRRWPTVSYVALAKELLNQGCPIVLLGGPDDRWVSEYFTGLNILDLVGQTSLTDMVALLDSASCAVTHDSGPIHLASITSVPLIGIFGPTPANAVVSFSRPKTVVLQPENRVSCSPCYDGRAYADCADNTCMQATTVEQVLAAVDDLVNC